MSLLCVDVPESFPFPNLTGRHQVIIHSSSKWKLKYNFWFLFHPSPFPILSRLFIIGPLFCYWFVLTSFLMGSFPIVFSYFPSLWVVSPLYFPCPPLWVLSLLFCHILDGCFFTCFSSLPLFSSNFVPLNIKQKLPNPTQLICYPSQLPLPLLDPSV